MQIQINGVQRDVAGDPQMPLLWALRDILSLTGTKYGCGIGACGSVHGSYGRQCGALLHPSQLKAT